MGINWQDITGFKLDRDFFRFFDTQKNGVLHFADLFPGLAQGMDMERCGTADFWNRWCRKNDDAENMQRGPKWVPSGPEEELRQLHESVQLREEVADKRKWIQATMRRLKNRGKSDARCREAVALHLPRGSGPKDRDGVQTISEADVFAFRRRYNEQVSDPVRTIQKEMVEMREQRRVLQNSKNRLWHVTEGPKERKRIEEDRKEKISSLAGNGRSLLGKVQDPQHEASASAKGSQPQPAGKSNKLIAQECNLELEEVDDLLKEFIRFADVSETIGRKGFSRLLQVLCPSRTLADNDIDAWWAQAAGGGTGRSSCRFPEFVAWFVRSELRMLQFVSDGLGSSLKLHQ
jgi:hypothetical protein